MGSQQLQGVTIKFVAPFLFMYPLVYPSCSAANDLALKEEQRGQALNVDISISSPFICFRNPLSSSNCFLSRWNALVLNYVNTVTYLAGRYSSVRSSV